MIPNHSPWIKQLKRTRPVVPIERDVSADVAIVGGGIAGVVTAYFTLKNTNRSVVLIEADKVAHGATGHNAGQITSYFERPFYELVKEFGLKMAAEGQKAIESAWMLLDEIYRDARLQTPLYRFTGYAGCVKLEQVLIHLKNNKYRLEGGLQAEAMVIAEESGIAEKIPPEYQNLYKIARGEDILALLETANPIYTAALSFQKGCLNSALFTEELIGYCIANYKDRFSFFEGSPVDVIELGKSHGELKALGCKVTAGKIILCTNGFENFTITNTSGEEIDPSFHHMVEGRIGYMAGYVEPENHPPTAISYFMKDNPPSDDPTGESYFYLTRRPHEHEGEESHNLICAGGPEKALPERGKYSREDAYSEEMQSLIQGFFEETYKNYHKGETEEDFFWHGLMGYTPNGIRRVGPEPKNPILFYNLGCNGVGILPSIYGGKRISEILEGKNLPPSIFDPRS